MGILSWMFVGLMAGWLTGVFMRGSALGLSGDILLGAAGGLWGGFLASAVFNVPAAMTDIHLVPLIVAWAGSLLLVFALRNSVTKPPRPILQIDEDRRK